MILKEQENISAIILSAGKSERMGVPKFSLKFDSKTTFLEKLIGEFSSFGCNEIIVVLNESSAVLYHQLKLDVPGNVRVVINHHPEWERFYSLKLAALALSEVRPVFVSNIDNPFVTKNILNSLTENIGNFDYISPSYQNKGGHPFLLSSKVVFNLKKKIEDQIHLKEYLAQYPRKMVEIDNEKVLLNINTVKDYLLHFKSISD